MKCRAIHRALAAVAIVCSAGSCGGSATSPSPQTLNLAGTWTGTWTFVVAGATVTDTVTLTLTQTGSTSAGPWSASGGAAGTVNFSTGDAISGTTSLSQTLITGQNCSANATLTGTATISSVQFTLGPIAGAGLCQWATGHQFAFTR